MEYLRAVIGIGQYVTPTLSATTKLLIVLWPGKAAGISEVELVFDAPNRFLAVSPEVVLRAGPGSADSAGKISLEIPTICGGQAQCLARVAQRALILRITPPSCAGNARYEKVVAKHPLTEGMKVWRHRSQFSASGRKVRRKEAPPILVEEERR